MWGKVAGLIKNGLKAKAGQAVADKVSSTEGSAMPGALKLICIFLAAPLLLALLVPFMEKDMGFMEMQGADSTAYANGLNSGVNVAPGEAASIEGEAARIEWLYDGKGVPQTEEESAAYLEDFEVEYLDENGDKQTHNMTMHRKLKTEVQAIFQDMMNVGFKLEWKSGGGSIRGWYDSGYSGAFYYSAHCYGHAIDINVDANPMPSAGVGIAYEPGVNPYSVTPEIVDIWKKHGFFWGGDWASTPDYMHFSYFDH